MTDSKMKIVAIITARGGSKGLPRKNVLPLNGKPLIAYTIEAALKSHVFDKVVVTTDDEEIKNVSLAFGAEVIDRPAELATDRASSIDVLVHAIESLKEEQFTHFMLLQPTSPLRDEYHIREAVALYKEQRGNSLVSVVEEQHPPYKLLVENGAEVIPLFSEKHLTMPRQQLPKTYRINGAIYLANKVLFLSSKNLFEKPLSIYKMSQQSSMDIDNRDDFECVSFYLNGKPFYKGKLKSKQKK